MKHHCPKNDAAVNTAAKLLALYDSFVTGSQPLPLKLLDPATFHKFDGQLHPDHKDTAAAAACASYAAARPQPTPPGAAARPQPTAPGAAAGQGDAAAAGPQQTTQEDVEQNATEEDAFDAFAAQMGSDIDVDVPAEYGADESIYTTAEETPAAKTTDNIPERTIHQPRNDPARLVSEQDKQTRAEAFLKGNGVAVPSSEVCWLFSSAFCICCVSLILVSPNGVTVATVAIVCVIALACLMVTIQCTELHFTCWLVGQWWS